MTGKFCSACWQDVRFGIRLLARHPLFTLAAALTIALGMGANISIFSQLDAVILHPLPGASAPEELVIAVPSSQIEDNTGFSYLEFTDYRQRCRQLSGLSACAFTSMNLMAGTEPERVWGELVAGDYFRNLGIPMALGRGFTREEDEVPFAHRVAVISYGLWQRRFGGKPDALGKTVLLNNTAFRIVGVAGREFAGTWSGLRFEIWVPVMMQKLFLNSPNLLEDRGDRWFSLLGRLAPGTSLDQAQQEFLAVSRQLASEFPSTNQGITATVVDLNDSPVGGQSIMGPVLWAMTLLTGLVLLNACANVANLLLARSAGRQREIALRLSLGAPRNRVVRQLLAESVLLSLLGGAGALLLASWTSSFMSRFTPPMEYPLATSVELNIRAFLFTAILSLATGILFGLAPALHASRVSLSSVLKDEGGAVTASRRKSVLRNVLVVVQLALSLIMLCSAGLFIRSLNRAQQADPGFDTSRTLLMALNLFPSGYTTESGTRFWQQLQERAAALPGVESAALTRRVPLGFGGTYTSTLEVEGYQPAPGEKVWSFIYWISPDYFRTIRQPVREGREFTAQDGPLSRPVVIVNETLAARYWPGRSPLGRKIRAEGEWMEVAGVVRDCKLQQLNERPRPLLYVPLAQQYRGEATLVVRTKGDPGASSGALRQLIAGLDPALPLYYTCTMDQYATAATYPQRMASTMLTASGVLVLIITIIGLYGVLAHAAAQRIREIGIRMAFGARPRQILGMILRQGVWLIAAGTVLGIAGAMFNARFFASLLFGISTSDPLVFTVVPLSLAMVALLASLLPARRAAATDPAVALRQN